ncbi:MAG: helix-turn-helix transcriptional regulator [Verrucomicrobia bacterium]|nr:helix-turn-helix transcriptional regulator [Verrucomicrobiota bacterium]MDA1088528.1 helix-turn-helix transcriptional regulator [Verrucomicrobiota bacterium]
MTHLWRSRSGTPPPIGEAIVRIGERVRLARTRRGLTQAEMAERMFVTRKTLSRLERGEPGVSLSVLASALWVLGLDSGLQELADPEHDAVGVRREQQRNPKRVRRENRDDALDF